MKTCFYDFNNYHQGFLLSFVNYLIVRPIAISHHSKKVNILKGIEFLINYPKSTELLGKKKKKLIPTNWCCYRLYENIKKYAIFVLVRSYMSYTNKNYIYNLLSRWFFLFPIRQYPQQSKNIVALLVELPNRIMK